MDSGANSDGSLDDISIVMPIKTSIRRAVNNMEKYNKYRATDKYWSGLFVIIFISWIVSCQYVTHYDTEYSYLSGNSSESKNTSSKLVYHSSIFPRNSTVFINILKFYQDRIDDESVDEEGCHITKKLKTLNLEREVVSFVGYLILDFFSFNLSRLNQNNDCVPIVFPLAHFMIGIMSLAFSVEAIYKKRTFYKQPVLIGATFFFVALLEHLSAMFYEKNSITFTLLSSHRKIAYWMIPETIFVILCIVRKYSGVPSKRRVAMSDKTLISFDYKFSIAVGIPVFVMLHLLAFYTISILQNVARSSALFYIIGGGCCYVGLTIYYYGAMVISCAIHVSDVLKKSSLTNVFRALCIVARYHFGTACYQATLIFPRIRATFMLKGGKPKELSLLPAWHSFITIHRDSHKFITTFTAVHGSSYVKSLKELLRFWSNGVIKRQYHYVSCKNYGCLSIMLLIFLLSINNGLLILIWMYDLDDSQFSLATRDMYLKIVLMFFLASTYLQATSDAYFFVIYRNSIRNSIDCATTESPFEKYFKEFESSYDEADSDDNGGDNDTPI